MSRRPRIGVISFPGTCDDRDALRAAELAGGEAVALWHGDADLDGCSGVIVPGGFSYGDYLRAGAIARFSPVLAAVEQFARDGLPLRIEDPGLGADQDPDAAHGATRSSQAPNGSPARRS